jgi:hypothetical protein
MANHWRKQRVEAVLAVVLLAAPVLLALASLLAVDRPAGPRAVGCLTAAAVFAIINVSLSVVRPCLYRWRTGSYAGMRHVSGIPMLGSLFVTFALVLGFGNNGVALTSLVILAVDTAGAFWALVAILRDGTVWRGGGSGAGRD